MLSEVAEILGLSRARVKNWTTGRSLTINPSISGRGTGLPNMYSQGDLYRLAIAARLNRDGLTARTIQHILDTLGTNITDSPFAIVTSGGRAYTAKKKSRLEVQIVSRQRFQNEGWTPITQQVPDCSGFYVLNIDAIAEEVNRRMHPPREGEAALITPSAREEGPPKRRKIRIE
jgi:DNA-binding transcriptional MerR regulator